MKEVNSNFQVNTTDTINIYANEEKVAPEHALGKCFSNVWDDEWDL